MRVTDPRPITVLVGAHSGSACTPRQSIAQRTGGQSNCGTLERILIAYLTWDGVTHVHMLSESVSCPLAYATASTSVVKVLQGDLTRSLTHFRIILRSLPLSRRPRKLSVQLHSVSAARS